MSFPLVSKLMTLNDLEWRNGCYFALFCGIRPLLRIRPRKMLATLMRATSSVLEANSSPYFLDSDSLDSTTSLKYSIQRRENTYLYSYVYVCSGCVSSRRWSWSLWDGSASLYLWLHMCIQDLWQQVSSLTSHWLLTGVCVWAITNL